MSATKSKDSRPPVQRGRRPGDPAAKRIERLVVRVHPDLVDALNTCSDEAGLSRSLFIERILVSYIRQDPRFSDMDHMGRRRDPTFQPTVASMRAFEQRWSRFTEIRNSVLGEDIPSEGHYGPAGGYDDHGVAADGSREKGPPRPRPPAPRVTTQPERILPHRGGRRKDRQKSGE